MPKDPTSDKLKARMQQWQSYVEQPVTDSDTFSVAKIAASRGSEKTASPRLLTGAVVSSDIVILRRNRSESSTVGATRVEVIHTAPLYDAEGRLLKPALAVPTFASAAGNTPRPLRRVTEPAVFGATAAADALYTGQPYATQAYHRAGNSAVTAPSDGSASEMVRVVLWALVLFGAAAILFFMINSI